MDMETMLDAAAILLGLAALGGLVMLFHRFGQNRNPPVWLAAGLTLLAYAAWATGIPPLAQAALGVLVVAALGGAVVNLRDHWKHVLLSRTWVIGHFVLAVTGFVLLLRVAWG
jgi:uncharacterized membrane protein YoaK (UPF0700 family)